MDVEKKDKPPEPAVDAVPLAPGVWETESPGFASVPPRAQSDLHNVANARKDEDAADPEGRDKECGTTVAQDVAQDQVEPRIERYRER
jgi:hypothetical protein